MLELDSLVVSRIATDTTMKTLLGVTTSDNRIYAWYPTTDITYTIGGVDSSIIYRNSMEGRPFRWSYPYQMPNIQYYFRVMSLSQLKLRQITERLIVLFDMTSLQSTNWGAKWITLSGSWDGMVEGNPTHLILSKNVTFDFSIVVKRV